MAEESFRDNIPSNSEINNLIEWFEGGEAEKIVGHVETRGDSGSWETFGFEVVTSDAEQHSIIISDEDLPEDFDWDDFFDFLDALAEEYDVDYDNDYGETG